MDLTQITIGGAFVLLVLVIIALLLIVRRLHQARRGLERRQAGDAASPGRAAGALAGAFAFGCVKSKELPARGCMSASCILW
jgi:hypothetical protein